MAKINGNEIRPGYVIEYQDTLWVAVKTMAVKPGKGPAYNQVELKNLIDGRKLNNRFGSDERVERARLEQKDFQFLYRQGDSLVFMDTDSYEQIDGRWLFTYRKVLIDSRVGDWPPPKTATPR